MSLITSQISKLIRNRKEHYGCNIEDDLYDHEEQPYKVSLLDFLILIISMYAAYLSWRCNTVKKIDVLLKIIYSFFAFLFGFPYVLFYVVFKEKITPC